jgi:hypothetical protein
MPANTPPVNWRPWVTPTWRTILRGSRGGWKPGSPWRELPSPSLSSVVSNRSHGLWRCSFRLTIATVMLDIGTEWTLNASLTRLSRYRRCSKRRISGHSAQATSRLRIEGTMKCLRIARGSGFGSGMASVAEPSPRHSDYRERGIKLPLANRDARSGEEKTFSDVARRR